MLGFLGMASVMSILSATSNIYSICSKLKSPDQCYSWSLNYLNYFVNRHIGFKNILIAFLYTSFEARAFASARQVKKLSKVGGGGGIATQSTLPLDPSLVLP